MMIAGMNPVQLKVATEIPPDFAVTDAMLPQGRTLATELQNKRLFTLDDDFLVSMAGKHIVGDETRKRGCPVFTPKDDPWDWFAARLFLLNCHFQIHQFRAHALWCHLMQEPVSISLNRMLPPCHPIYKLLRPHFRGLASINAKARGSLVASADRQSLYSKQGDVMTVGATGNIKVAQLAYAKNTYEGIFFRNRLRETGILDDIAIGDHPYRDDGLLLLESIEKYVCKIVDIYYPTDASVAADIELQAWARDVVTEGKVVGFPGNGAITSKDMLSYICSNIIFIGAAFHGAVNFAQIVFAGNVANMPGSLLAPPPTEKGKLTEKDILAMLPSHGAALIQIGLLMILSTNSTERLGHIPQELFVDEAALKAQKEWREDLENVEKTIQMRNLGRAETYNGFLPSVTPNSTAI
ncbi:lipoxygenase [Zopfochytrium polystomum]|nr:lipoxygenase [Zopfochytrium polystomum]